MIILGSNHNLIVSLCPYIFELLKIKCFRCNKALTTFSHTGKNNLPWCDYICLDCDLKYEVKSHFNCKYFFNKNQCNKDLFIGGNIETFNNLESKPCLIIINFNICIMRKFLKINITSIRYYNYFNYNITEHPILRHKTHIKINTEQFNATYDYNDNFSNICSYKIVNNEINNIKLNDFDKIQKLAIYFNNVSNLKLYNLNKQLIFNKNIKNGYDYAVNNLNYFNQETLVKLCFDNMLNYNNKIYVPIINKNIKDGYDYAVNNLNYFNQETLVKLCFNDILNYNNKICVNISVPTINKNINFNVEKNNTKISDKIINKSFLFVNLIKKFFGC